MLSAYTPSRPLLGKVETEQRLTFDAGFWAASAYITLYIIRPWEVLIPELASVQFERIAVAIIVATMALSGGLRWRLDPLIGAVLFFASAIMLSAETGYSFAYSWSAPDGLYVYLTKLLALVLIVSGARTPRQLVMLQLVFVLAVAVFAGKALWEYGLNTAGRQSMGVYRLRGISHTFGHPNAVATLLVPALPYWLASRRSEVLITCRWARSWQQCYRWAMFLVPALIFLCVLLTGSRAGTLGLLAFLLLAAFHARSRIGAALLIFVVVGAAWMSMSDANRQRIRSIWDAGAAVGGGQESKEGRAEGLRAGIEMFRRFPVTGVGIGNFSTYRQRELDGSDLAAHNIAGEVLGELGLMGAAAFGILLFSVLKATRQIGRMAARCQDEMSISIGYFAIAARHSIYLLLLLGLANHLSFRFNWIWLAAFCSCMLWTLRQQPRSLSVESALPCGTA